MSDQLVYLNYEKPCANTILKSTEDGLICSNEEDCIKFCNNLDSNAPSEKTLVMLKTLHLRNVTRIWKDMLMSRIWLYVCVWY